MSVGNGQYHRACSVRGSGCPKRKASVKVRSNRSLERSRRPRKCGAEMARASQVETSSKSRWLITLDRAINIVRRRQVINPKPSTDSTLAVRRNECSTPTARTKCHVLPRTASEGTHGRAASQPPIETKSERCVHLLEGVAARAPDFIPPFFCFSSRRAARERGQSSLQAGHVHTTPQSNRAGYVLGNREAHLRSPVGMLGHVGRSRTSRMRSAEGEAHRRGDMRRWLHLQRAPPPRGPNLIGTPPAAECERALLTNSPPLVRFALSPTQPRQLLSGARTFYDVRYAVTRGPGKERNALARESVFAIKVYIREEGKRRRYWIIDERLTGLYPLIGNPFGEALLFGFFPPRSTNTGGARARFNFSFSLAGERGSGRLRKSRLRR